MTTNNEDTARNERHENRMAKKKAVIDEKIKHADKEQGVIVITTGNGKGKRRRKHHRTDSCRDGKFD